MSNTEKLEQREEQLRGIITLLKGAMNASAGALDEDLDDLETSRLARAHREVRSAIHNLREVANICAATAVRRHLLEASTDE